MDISKGSLLLVIGFALSAFAQITPKSPACGVSDRDAGTRQNCCPVDALRSAQASCCGKDNRFVELVPSADQIISGSHALIMRNPADSNFSLEFDPLGIPIEEHNSFAIGMDLYTHADAGFRAPYINFYKSRGPRSAPAPVTLTGYELDSIGGINFGGYDGSGYFAGSAAIYTQADEDWSSTRHGGHISIYGTNNGPFGHTQQLIQFGGIDPNGRGDGNIIAYRPLTFHGNSSNDPGIYPISGPAKLTVRTADNLGDAALTAKSFQSKAAAFSTYPACDADTEGQMAAINDSSTNIWGAAVSGGGGNHVLAYCDGTEWTVAAK
jgi:hypothetical protein